MSIGPNCFTTPESSDRMIDNVVWLTLQKRERYHHQLSAVGKGRTDILIPIPSTHLTFLCCLFSSRLLLSHVLEDASEFRSIAARAYLLEGSIELFQFLLGQLSGPAKGLQVFVRSLWPFQREGSTLVMDACELRTRKSQSRRTELDIYWSFLPEKWTCLRVRHKNCRTPPNERITGLLVVLVAHDETSTSYG